MEYILNGNLFLFLLNLLLLFFLFVKKRQTSLLSPSFVLSLVVFVFIILGNINLLFFQKNLSWFVEIEPTKGNNIALLSLAIFISIFLFYKPTKSKIFQHVSTIVKLERLDLILKSLSIISFLFNVLNYKAIGGLVIFKSNLTGYERFDLMQNLPFPKALVLSSFLICPIIIRLILSKTNKSIFIVLLITNVLLSFGLGQRHFIFMPALTAFIFLYFINKVSVKTIWLAMSLFPILVALTSIFRGDLTNAAFSDISTVFGNEYRDYLRQREENIPLQYGKTIYPVLLNPIPKQIYTLFDLEKSDYSLYSAYILADVWGNQSGQRSGIWGEFHLNYGDFGVVVCFSIFAFVILYIENRLCKPEINLKRKFIFSYLFTLSVFSIIGSWATIGDDLGSYGIFYLLIYLTCFKKKYKNPFESEVSKLTS